jgi:hypothetical protein
MMDSTSDDHPLEEPDGAAAGPAAVGPEDEKREALHGEPSAAQAVKEEARRKLQAGTEAAGPEGTLMGLDAPGFGERSADELRRIAASRNREAAAREEATVDAEFGGLDNDLIDMGDFGEGGTGAGTQTGGAGERLRPVGTGKPPRTDDDGTS